LLGMHVLHELSVLCK